MLTLMPVPSLRLLLVEADTAVAAALRRGFVRAGWTVLCAPAAQAALEVLAGFAPDAALIGLDLPDMDGGKLVAEVVRDGRCAVVAMSGQGEAGRQGALDGGAHDYLPKPMPMRDMLDRLQAAVLRRVSLPAQAAA